MAKMGWVRQEAAENASYIESDFGKVNNCFDVRDEEMRECVCLCGLVCLFTPGHVAGSTRPHSPPTCRYLCLPTHYPSPVIATPQIFRRCSLSLVRIVHPLVSTPLVTFLCLQVAWSLWCCWVFGTRPFLISPVSPLLLQSLAWVYMTAYFPSQWY